MRTKLLGLAHHLPPETAVAGVERPTLQDPGGPSDLALPAAHAALAHAGLEVGQVDFLVFATMTPDVTFPGAACFFQEKLGCGTIGALDIRGQCTGFLMALMVADSFLAAGVYERILLAAAEVHSSGLDYSGPGARVAALYGDGAAAAVLGRDAGGIESVVCHSDGRFYDKFWCEYPASNHHPVRITPEIFRLGKHFPTLDFQLVEDFGRTHLPQVVAEAMAQAGVAADAVDLFVMSHIMPAVADDCARVMRLPSSKVCNAGVRHGHLTAASLPVALSEAIGADRVGPGARVCLAACGAGFTWGATVLRL